MSNSAEKLEPQIVESQTEGDTLKITTSVHFVAETEEARRKKREIHADRATIGRAREVDFKRRVWHGVTETYQHLKTREQLRRYHDEGVNITSPSAAFNVAKAQIDELRASEREEAESLALQNSLDPDVYTGYRDRDFLHKLEADNAGVDDNGNELGPIFLGRAKEIISQFALGNINKDQLNEQTEALASDLRKEYPGLFSRSEVGSDLALVAKQARKAYRAGGKLSKIDIDLDFYLGGVGGAFATEEKRDLADVAIDWAQESKTKSVIFNPLTIGIGASIGALAGRTAAKYPLLLVPGIGSAVGGILAGVRRWSKENKDRYLKQREEEIGYEIQAPVKPSNLLEKGLAVALGQTNFRESSYQPISALETTERIEELLNASDSIKQADNWQNQTLSLIAEVRERIDLSEGREIGLVKFGQRRKEDGQIEATGTSTMDRDKLKLLTSAAVAEKELKAIIGDTEFDIRYAMAGGNVRSRLTGEVSEANLRFRGKKFIQSVRSAGFAGTVGMLGAFGTRLAFEGVEKGLEKVTDAVDDLKEHVIEKAKEDIPLGDGKLETITQATKDVPGLKIEVPEGYKHQIDPENHLVILDGPDGQHFEVRYSEHMSEGQAKLALEVAGLKGDVSTATEIIGDGAHLVQQEILKPDYLASHNLTEITGQQFHFSFGHAYDILEPGEHEYNELTLYQHTGLDWSIGPHGLDGSPISPFVYTDEPAWADPAIVANAPVNREDLVAFYQLRDGAGNWHTLLAGQNGGHFKLPEEFLDPQTGKVDGIGIIGYGMVRDSSGHIIPADQVLTHPELISSGTLHSMASIPLEQKARVIAEQFSAPTIQVSDLTETVEKTIDTVVDKDHNFDIDWSVATPFAPRIFPDIATEPPGREIPPPYGYPQGRLRSEKKRFYKDRLSKTLRDNPGDSLNAEKEIPAYLARQEQSHIKELENFLSQEGMKEPMDDQCRAVVCIPVYTLGEGKIIRNTLEQYLMQVDKTKNRKAIDPEKVELIIFLNHARPNREKLEAKLSRQFSEGAEERVRAGNVKEYDTEEVIRQFQSEHPELRIRVMKTEFDQRPAWGKIIKILYDTALLRSSKRANPEFNDPLIITNDADLVKISPAYLHELVEFADSGGQRIDGWVGKIDMPNHGYEKYPSFLVAERLYQFLDAQNRRKESGAVVTQGRNTALRASTYAAIGGANPDTDAGADTELGTMVARARRNPKTIKYVNRVWLETDPRREIEAWSKGVTLGYAWDSWGQMDKYGQDLKGRFDSLPQDQIDKELLERAIYFELERWNLSPASKEITRALRWLGFTPSDYHVGTRTIKHPRGGVVNTETIIIDSLDHVKENLRQYISQKRWEKTDRKVQSLLVPSGTQKRIETRPAVTTAVPQAVTAGPAVSPEAAPQDEETRPVTPPASPAQGEEGKPIWEQVVDIESEDVFGEVKYYLEEKKADAYIFRTEPSRLVKYLKGLPLPLGAKVKDLKIKIVEDNQVVLEGLVTSLVGRTEFKVKLANDPAGKLQVVSQDLKQTGAHSRLKGEIESRMARIDSELASAIGREIGDKWQVAQVSLDDGKFAFEVEKTPEAVKAEELARLKSAHDAADAEELARAEELLARAIATRQKAIASQQGQGGEKRPFGEWIDVLGQEHVRKQTKREGKPYVLDSKRPIEGRIGSPLEMMTRGEAERRVAADKLTFNILPQGKGIIGTISGAVRRPERAQSARDISAERVRAHDRRVKLQRAAGRA